MGNLKRAKNPSYPLVKKLGPIPIIPRLKKIQIHQHNTCHLSKAYSFRDLTLD